MIKDKCFEKIGNFSGPLSNLGEKSEGDNKMGREKKENGGRKLFWDIFGTIATIGFVGGLITILVGAIALGNPVTIFIGVIIVMVCIVMAGVAVWQE